MYTTDKKILYLLPSPSMEGGMTITTHMFYETGLFNNPKIKHFNTSFTWSKSNIIRAIQSCYLKLSFIYKLLTFKPDAIFVIASPFWGYYDKIFYCFIAKIVGVPSYFNNVSAGFVHFYEQNRFNKWFVELTIKIPTAIVLGSPFWTNYFKKNFPLLNTVEIANPVICDNFKSTTKPIHTDNKVRIVSAFRITIDKGVEELVEVIKGVCSKTPNIEFTILGDGPKFKWMKTELKQLENTGQVHIKGFLDGEHKIKEIVNADAYLMLTHYDMMPIAILEAMSAGLAIFSTNVGGIPDMVEENKNAILFEKNETENVIKTLLQYADKKEQIKQMGAISCTIVNERYNIDLIINKQLAIINSVKIIRTKFTLTNNVKKVVSSTTTNLYNLILEHIFFKLGDILMGTQFISLLKKHRIVSNLSEKELEVLSTQKLESILNFAQSKSQYYKSLNIKTQANPELTLQQFPILTKAILRSQLNNILTTSSPNLIKYETSGSSGIPIKIYLDKKEESECRAILINWWEWTGNKLGNPILQTGMTTTRGLLKSIKDKLTNTIYMDAFHLTDTDILNILKKINNTKHYHFGGYASSLYVVAKVAEEHQLNIQFKGVISWGDKMFPHYQSKIEAVFNTKVFENYACNEGLMIGQKIDLPYFYIYTPNVFVELLDDNNQPVKDGEMGRVIITKLDGFVTPLIRYETGDLAIKLPREKYPNERKFNFPLLQMVIGRDTDIILTPEGNRLIVHTFTGIFEFYPEIKQFRVIQEEKNTITIEYIKSESFNTVVIQLIEKEFRAKTNTNILINWIPTDFIPNSPSGKPQLIKNTYLKELRNS